MRLPPLNALRAFEAAARHQGFAGASQELHVTRGAISRQVKLLEEHLGILLFTRQAQGVQLTAAGKKLLPVLSDAFAHIIQGTRHLSSEASDLHVICPPATSIRWLIPRLENFRKKHPDIGIRLTTDFHSGRGFDQTEYDIGFSVENWPNRIEDIALVPLFPVYLTPACSPATMAKFNLLEKPDKLSRMTLLHETPRHHDWTAWIRQCNIKGIDPTAGEDFPNLDMATKAAVMGAGIVMADLALCRDELEAGLLVRPFKEMICESPLGAICLLGPREKWHDPKVEAFKTWAIETATTEVTYLSTFKPL